MINLSEFFSLSHLALLGKEIKLWFTLGLELLHGLFVLFVVLHQDATLVCKVVCFRLFQTVYG